MAENDENDVLSRPSRIPVSYHTLEHLAAYLNLPKEFLREMAERGSIPFVGTGKYSVSGNSSDKTGRMYFDVHEVKKALNEIAEWQRARRADGK